MVGKRPAVCSDLLRNLSRRSRPKSEFNAVCVSCGRCVCIIMPQGNLFSIRNMEILRINLRCFAGWVSRSSEWVCLLGKHLAFFAARLTTILTNHFLPSPTNGSAGSRDRVPFPGDAVFASTHARGRKLLEYIRRHTGREEMRFSRRFEPLRDPRSFTLPRARRRHPRALVEA